MDSAVDRNVDDQLQELVHTTMVSTSIVLESRDIDNLRKYTAYACDKCQVNHFFPSSEWAAFVRSLTLSQLHLLASTKVHSGMKPVLNELKTIEGWDDAWNATLLKAESLSTSWRQQVCQKETQDMLGNKTQEWLIPCEKHANYHHVAGDVFQLLKNYLCTETHYTDVFDYRNLPALLPVFIREELKRFANKLTEELREQSTVWVEPTVEEVPQRKKSKEAFYYLKYIIPVDHVPEDLLVEYNKCGRKTRYESVSEAHKVMEKQGVQDSKVCYKCRYCDGYHFGSQGSSSSIRRKKQVRNGAYWYRLNPNKANQFIMRVLYS